MCITPIPDSIFKCIKYTIVPTEPKGKNKFIRNGKGCHYKSPIVKQFTNYNRYR